MTAKAMPRNGAYWLSDRASEPLGIICESCSLLRFFDTRELMDKYGDQSLPSFLSTISKEIVGCQLPKNVFSGPRCTLTYYRTRDQQAKETTDSQAARRELTRRDATREHAVIALCRSCNHVSRISHSLLDRIFAPETPLRALVPVMRCKACGLKGKGVVAVIKVWER